MAALVGPCRPWALMAVCSIIIPTHNRLALVRDAVASALAALPSGGEVLVIDDGSTTPVAGALADLAGPTLRVLVNPSPGGAAQARNFGAAQALGPVLFFLDDDDRIVPGYPTAMLARAAAMPDLSYGHSAIRTVDSLPRAPLTPGRFTQGRRSETLPFKRRLAGLGCGFWIRRQMLLDIGGIAEDLVTNEDTDLSVRLIAGGAPGWVCDGPGVEVLRHPSAPGSAGQITHRTDPASRAACFAAIPQRNAAFFGANRSARGYLLQRLLKMVAKTGDRARGTAIIAAEPDPMLRLQLRAYFTANLWLYRR